MLLQIRNVLEGQNHRECLSATVINQVDGAQEKACPISGCSLISGWKQSSPLWCYQELQKPRTAENQFGYTWSWSVGKQSKTEYWKYSLFFPLPGKKKHPNICPGKWTWQSGLCLFFATLIHATEVCLFFTVLIYTLIKSVLKCAPYLMWTTAF